MLMPSLTHSEAIKLVTDSFRFLVDEFGFIGPIEWNVSYERMFTYFRGISFVTVSLEGGFLLSVGKTKMLVPGLASGQTTLSKVPHDQRRELCVMDLVSPGEWKAILDMKDHSEVLRAYGGVLRKHSDLLKGDWSKRTLRYRLLQRFRSALEG